MIEYVECLQMVELKRFIEDEKTPALLAAYGRLLISGDSKDLRRCQAAEMIQDRLHGRPKQSTEVSGKDGQPLMPSNVIVANQQDISKFNDFIESIK